jgi:hypothetical protein
MTPDLTDDEAALIAEAKKLGEEIRTILPPLIAARKNWLRSRNETDAQKLEAIQAQADMLAARHKLVIEETQRLSGIPEEVLQALEKAQIRGDADDRIFREDLAADRVAPSNDIDELLPTALEGILRAVNPKWLRADISEQHRLSEITTGEPLSLVKGIRRQSAFPEIHRFSQTLRVAIDYLSGHCAYDHFAGALLVPQLTCLGSKLTVLRTFEALQNELRHYGRVPVPALTPSTASNSRPNGRDRHREECTMGNGERFGCNGEPVEAYQTTMDVSGGAGTMLHSAPTVHLAGKATEAISDFRWRRCRKISPRFRCHPDKLGLILRRH